MQDDLNLKTEKYTDVKFSNVLTKLDSMSTTSDYESKFSCIKEMLLHSSHIQNVKPETY